MSIDNFDKYGLPGIIIFGMGWFILYMFKEHRKERKEWADSQDKKDEKHNKSQERTIEVMSELSAIIKQSKK